MLGIRIARRTLAAALTLGAALSLAPAARAEAPLPPFGRAGQVVLDDLIGVRSGAPGYLGQLASGVGPAGAVLNGTLGMSGLLGYGHFTSASTGPLNAGFSSNTIWVAPAVDVFVAPRLSIGAGLGASYGWQNPDALTASTPAAGVPAMRAWSLSALPRIGYVWPIASRFAVWPRLSFGYAYARSEQRYPGAMSSSPSYVTSSATWIGGVEVKLVYQATRHVFFDVAPYLSVRHATSEIATEFHDVTRSFVVGMGGTVGMGVVL